MARPWLVVVSFLAVTALAISPARAEKAHKTLRDFVRTGKYILFVSRKQQKKVRIYHSKRGGAFLILDSDFGKPFVILPREKRVATLAKDQVVNLSDKKADLAATVELETIGEIGLDGRDITISQKGKGLIARLKPQPYALGRLTAEQLLVHAPEYEVEAARYRPDSDDVQRLVDSPTEMEVLVFFGSWCPTCKRLVPRVLRVNEAIEGSKIHITYYGLPRGKAMRKDPEAKKYGITHVPTGIVFVKGKKVGRITPRSLNRPESAICAAVAKAAR